ncbi:hypothetical protein DOTSEDRAFT_151250 [Dothistroma septosporum NZE10]|uniref:DNA mismatch repair proteins mutS family domain-containing protein n=1 Tax=Dothistroma septosporum (strain NZE10 / CBS 128990) TaxID=675120 RepID=N1PJS1_DOTSN|nr:hypothetical protein DOTSEDRAFT_151250 [Dothistroma septosporum NZE10]
MNGRALRYAARCSLHLSPAGSASLRTKQHVRNQVQQHPQTRGSKTRSTIKADRLPQGALAPMPKHDVEILPEKTYPTVLQQHLNNIRKFKDCIVLTRIGDFYEMYFDQVEEYAPLVNLKKAKRATSLGDVPMAGFQHTQLDRYLKMFVQDLGKQVAISEQIRLPESERIAKGGSMLFDRKVTRIVTAGTLIDESFVDPFENNYLLAIHIAGALPSTTTDNKNRSAHDYQKRGVRVGCAWIDLPSGDFFTQSTDLGSLPSLVARIGPREIVLDSSLENADRIVLQRLISDADLSVHFHTQTPSIATVSDWSPMLEKPVSDHERSEFTPFEVAAGNLVLGYVKEKLGDAGLQLQAPVRRLHDETMTIDRQSLRNLEVRTTLRDGMNQGSLLHAIRQTMTKSGARLLGERLVSPSMSLPIIDSRLDLVQELLQHEPMREHVTALLRRSSDTCRLLQKFSVGRGDADDLLGLARTVEVMHCVADLLHSHILAHQEDLTTEHAVNCPDLTFLWDILRRLDLETPSKVAQKITSAIDEAGLNQQQLTAEASMEEAEQMAEEVMAADEAGTKIPRLSRRAAKSPSERSSEEKPEDIWIMRRDASVTLGRAHSDLDNLLHAKRGMALKLQQDLRSPSLTLRWSAQLGHFCHIKGKDAKGALSTLAGARVIGSTKSTRSFYLSDWTYLGVRIDDSKLRIRAEEERVFGKLRAEVLENLMKLRRNAAVLDELDVACSSALVAKRRGLVRPILRENTTTKIVGGRHPTVDVGLREQGRKFTSNDCTVGDTERVLLITGPNMAGKSTFLRQTALITILAQTGCFVPADYAEVGLVDKIFSRVGSADNLYQDQSTFMVEMLETAEILKEATPRSFVIMDEVGRGTTPEDGIAVGYACLHHLHNVNQCRSLFATHFHVLADMTADFGQLSCYCTDVAEQESGSWMYDHKLRRGVNRSSHALKVAKLAGMPDSAVEIAAGVLAELQRNKAPTYGASHDALAENYAANAAAAG